MVIDYDYFHYSHKFGLALVVLICQSKQKKNSVNIQIFNKRVLFGSKNNYVVKCIFHDLFTKLLIFFAPRVLKKNLPPSRTKFNTKASHPVDRSVYENPATRDFGRNLCSTRKIGLAAGAFTSPPSNQGFN